MKASDVHSLRSKTVSGIFWLAGTRALGQAITWFITIYVIRLLAPQDYGLMGMAVLVIGFMLLFNELGLGAALVQRAELNASQVSNLAWAIFLMNFALFVLLLICAPLVARYFREPGVTNIVRVLAATFVISGIGSPSGHMLSRELAFKKTSRAEFAGNLAGAFSTLLLALTGFGVWSLVIGYVVQVLVINSLYLVYYPLRRQSTFSIANIRSYINFGLQIASARILWYVSSSADFMVVGRVLGTAQLGYYNLAFQLASLPIDKGVSIVTQVAFPVFSARQNDHEALRRHYLKLVSALALLTCPICLGLFAVGDQAIRVFLTSQWIPVILPFRILCLVSWLRGIVSLNSPLVIAKGKPRIIITNFLLQAIVMPISFYAGARYGLTGVSMAWVLAWPVLAAIITWQTLQLIELPVASYLNSLKHPLIGSVVMVVCVMLFQRYVPVGGPSALRLALAVAVGGVTYLGYIALFNRTAIHDGLEIVRSAKGTRAPAPTVAASPHVGVAGDAF